MKPFHYFVVVLVIVSGIAMAAALLPRESELALIYFKDKNFAEARGVYEKRLAEGDLSPSLVMTLSQLYLQYGQVAEATALLEKYLKVNPADTDARSRLGRLYQYGQRPYDYQINLESLAQERPTEAALRELNDIYSFVAQFDRQIETLQKLIELFPGKPEDYMNLAALQAGRQQFAGAAETLAQFEAKFAGQMTAEILQLRVSLLIDAGQIDEAERRVSAWLQQHPNQDAAARLAGVFSFKGQPGAALRLLTPFENQAVQSDNLVSSLIQLEIQAGQQTKALARLEKLSADGRLTARLYEPFIDLLLQKPDVGRAIELAETVHLDSIPDWLLSNLADAALASNRPEFTDRLVRQLGENFLAGFPLLGAHLADARGDDASLRRWIALAEQANLTPSQKIDLANLYVKTDRRADAMKLLESLAGSPDTPDSAVVDLANLYLDNNAASEGVALLAKIHEQRPSLEIGSAWVRLAAAAGQETEAVDWVRYTAHQVPSQTLTDLFFIASERKLYRLAVLAAQRIHQRAPQSQNTRLLSQALVDAGRPADALYYLRQLMAASPDAETESMYVSALTTVRQTDTRVTDELRRYWSEKIETSGLDPGRREELVFALLDLNSYETALPSLRKLAQEKSGEWLGAYVNAASRLGRRQELIEFLQTELARADLPIAAREPHMFALLENGGEAEAIPYLKEFADSLGGNWIFSYEEALTKTNRKPELLDFLRERAARADISAQERFDIAGRILESGNKAAAEKILMDVAATAGPESREVGQLLFLWGPRPPTYGLDWIEARARQARGADAEMWLDHLLNLNAAARSASVAAFLLKAGAGSRVLDGQIRALTASQDTAAFTSVVRREIQRQDNPETLRRYGRLAMEIGELETARLVFARMLESAPLDAEALRRFGALSFTAGNYADARQNLARYFERNETDYESDFIYGEIMVKDNDPLMARLHFERSFEAVERTTRKTYAMRVVRAQLLDRLGRTADSVDEFNSLLKERPGDKHLRADFITVLLRAGRLDEASRILGRR